MEQVKKATRSKNFYFTIYSYVLNHSKLPSEDILNISKQNRTYYIRALRQAKLIDRIGYGVWKVTGDFNQEIIGTSKKINTSNLNTHSLKPDNIRGHAFMWCLKIPKIANWDKRRQFFNKEGITFKPLNNLGDGERIEFKGRKVHLKSHSIIIYDKESYIAEKVKETKSLAIYEFLSLVKSLENLLKVSLTINKQYRFKVCREHYALIKNALAKQYDKEGKRLYVYNDRGLWLIIDNSLNLHELEAIKLGEAVNDAEGMQAWANSMKETGFKVTPDFILHSLNQLIQDRQYYAENLKSHVSAIQALEAAVKKLAKDKE
jgi:hypothetical protein